MMKPNSESDYQSSYPFPALLVESGVAWLAFKNYSPTVLLKNLAAMADFVLEAAVVGVPDPVWGEKAMGIILLFKRNFSNNTHFEALEPHFQAPKCRCKAPAVLLTHNSRLFQPICAL
jgi:hypothetical protein